MDSLTLNSLTNLVGKTIVLLNISFSTNLEPQETEIILRTNESAKTNVLTYKTNIQAHFVFASPTLGTNPCIFTNIVDIEETKRKDSLYWLTTATNMILWEDQPVKRNKINP